MIIYLRSRLFLSLASVGLAVSFGVVIYLLWLIFEPFKPPTLTSPIPILNPDKIIHQGQTISTAIDYCIYRQVHSITSRRYENLDDKQVFLLSTSVSDGAKPGCGRVVSNTTPVPNSIPPGHYRIILDSTFTVNPLKTVTQTYYTEEFEVQ